MPQIGPLEILVVSAVALIVFGPQKLPEIARSIGKAAAELRRVTTEVRDEFATSMDDDDDEPADEESAQSGTGSTERSKKES